MIVLAILAVHVLILTGVCWCVGSFSTFDVEPPHMIYLMSNVLSS